MNHSDEIDELEDQHHAEPVLRAFVEEVRAYASGPPPVVRSDLAAVLAGGVGAAARRDDPVVARRGRAEGLLGRALGGIQGRRGRLALGASVLGLSVLGTGGAGALPGPAQDVFERTVEAVGIELPEEVRQSDPLGPEDRAPQDPAPDRPVKGGDREAPEAPQPPPPRDDRRPDGRPGQDDPTSPTIPGTIPPEARDGTGAPGDGLRRESRRDRPASPPSTPAPPVSPPRADPPGASPGAPPERAPAGIPEEDSAELGGRPAQLGAGAQQSAELRTSAPPRS